MVTWGRGWMRSLEIFQEVVEDFLVTRSQSENCMERVLNDIISRFYTPFSH